VSLECAGEFQLQASELFQKYAKLSKKLGPQEPEKKRQSRREISHRGGFSLAAVEPHINIHFIGEC
jgi:hypothetical protein